MGKDYEIYQFYGDAEMLARVFEGIEESAGLVVSKVLFMPEDRSNWVLLDLEISWVNHFPNSVLELKGRTEKGGQFYRFELVTGYINPENNVIKMTPISSPQ